MQITIKNCNNIDQGQVEIKENSLNIKHAINGTGKRTIARSIVAAVSDLTTGSKELLRLLPYKHKGSKNIKSEVSGCEDLKNILVFDEKYINEILFKEDELVKGSFEIFVRGEAYDKGLQEIDGLLAQMRSHLEDDPDLTVLLKDFDEILAAFGKEIKSGGIHASSAITQAFKGGNHVANIPAGLEIYAKYIQHDENFRWVEWQQGGASFLDIADDCPYCAGEAKSKIETIRKVSEVYNPKDIQNLNKIVNTFNSLNKYFSESTRTKIASFVSKLESRNEEESAFLGEVRGQIQLLKQRINRARSMNFSTLKDVEKVIDWLNETKIDLSLYFHLQSESTQTKIDGINQEVEKLLDIATKIQGGVARQKALISALVKTNKTAIDDFLKNAGYSYHVLLIEDASGKHQLKLEHNDISGEVTEVRSRLSFGERNAFALILFMFDALKKNADLIILDDPISSFDKNKKYAIMEMLFAGKEASSFRGRTVLMLSHDFEPVVDVVCHHRRRFGLVTASFLENKGGAVSEIAIDKSDIQTFVEVNLNNVKMPIEDIHKAIYLRRYVEVSGQFPYAFSMLSSIIHRREWPTIRVLQLNSVGIEELVDRPMTQEEFDKSLSEIRLLYSEFDYAKIFAVVKDDNQMKSLYQSSESNYEKLHIYRMIFDEKEDHINSAVIIKFINQAFHIENDYIYQLNPRKYQMVPQYVIDECDKHIHAMN